MLKKKGHFINSVLSVPRTFSCALDSFLEIASCLFFPHLSSLTVRNEFTDLLFNTCGETIELNFVELEKPQAPAARGTGFVKIMGWKIKEVSTWNVYSVLV